MRSPIPEDLQIQEYSTIFFFDMWRRTVWYKFSAVSEEWSSSVFYYENRGSTSTHTCCKCPQSLCRHVSGKSAFKDKILCLEVTLLSIFV